VSKNQLGIMASPAVTLYDVVIQQLFCLFKDFISYIFAVHIFSFNVTLQRYGRLSGVSIANIGYTA